MKSLVIVNPAAGNGKAGKNWKQWKQGLEQTVGAFDTIMTTHPGHGEVLARQAILDGYEHIHAFGGDGTATEVVNGFFQNGQQLRPECLFSVWPGGTACDFHRGLQLPETFRNRRNSSIAWIDVGRLTFLDHRKKSREQYFLNIASCGISGFVDQLMTQKRRNLGSRLEFLVNGIEALIRYKNRRVRIRTDRGDLGESLVRLVAVANGKYFGAGMKIAPDAQIDDGRFQLVVIGDIGLIDALARAPQIYAGTFIRHPKIQIQDITWAELTSDEEVLLDLDGEALGTLPLRVDIIPAAIRLKTY